MFVKAIIGALGLGALMLATSPAYAIGVGECAVRAYSGNRGIDEVRVLRSRTGSYNREVCGYYVGDYHVRKIHEWRNKSYCVWIMCRSGSGRYGQCNLSGYNCRPANF
ncbi:hypothetical protein [uncultured Cohaesibacter sp.]|uniref:hypothetical protein n=1 Tax=uncultured Cohaesibacter sp. TaxID=1002546 RepID=UPI00292FB3C8|nr:hypothetical protein [uncultured Cohaesibacter sp.]